MTAAAATFFVTDTWNAELYGSLSVTSRLSAVIKNSAARFKIVWFFNKTNDKLETMLNALDKSIADAQDGKVKKNSGSVDKAAIEKTISNLDDLYNLLDSIHSACTRHRLNNSSLMAPGMGKLRRNAERISELADWLRDMLNPTYKELFASAMREYENGESVPASEVCH